VLVWPSGVDLATSGDVDVETAGDKIAGVLQFIVIDIINILTRIFQLRGKRRMRTQKRRKRKRKKSKKKTARTTTKNVMRRGRRTDKLSRNQRHKFCRL
jgi:hypothetical protein